MLNGLWKYLSRDENIIKNFIIQKKVFYREQDFDAFVKGVGLEGQDFV